jgi:hypothetical protein
MRELYLSAASFLIGTCAGFAIHTLLYHLH